MNLDIRKLLGGYATGTLTEAERQELFAAALDDQQLFEALADEHALKELLDDPAARAELLRATTETPHFSVAGLLREWFDRPKAKVLVAVGALLFLTIGIKEVMQFRPAAPDAAKVAMLHREQPAASKPDSPALLQSPRVDTVVKAPAPQSRAASQRAPQPSAPGAAPIGPPAAAEPARAGRVEMRDVRERDEILPLSAPPAVAPLEVTTQVAAEKKAVAEAVAAAPAAAPPPPPPPAKAAIRTAADTLTKEASLGALRLRYTVLRRSPDGNFDPVPPEYRFAAGDHARLRIEANLRGVVVVRDQSGKPVYSGPISSGAPAVLPVDWSFERTDAHTLQIAFAPLAETDSAMGFAASADQARQDESRRKDAPAGTAVAPARAKTAGRANVVLNEAEAAPAITIPLTLRRR